MRGQRACFVVRQTSWFSLPRLLTSMQMMLRYFANGLQVYAQPHASIASALTLRKSSREYAARVDESPMEIFSG